MTSALPKAVFLDVGWTLVYPRNSLWDIFASIGRDAGVALSAEGAEKLVHQLMAGRRDQALAEFEAGAQYSDSDEEFVRLFDVMGRLIFSMAGVPGDHAVLGARFLERFWTLENWAPFPDVIDSMRHLREHGVKVGVLSNASSDLLDLLDALGILECCDFTVVSAIEGTKKPDRRIFEVALRRSGAEPCEAVHVGDMFVEDIVGARAVGVRPLLMDRGELGMFPNHPESGSHPPGTIEVVRDLAEVLSAIGL
jgi:HAD superfamily hydrolase (TIGR01549 family)